MGVAEDRIINEDIRKSLGVVNVEDKMKENCLIWLGMCKDEGELVCKEWVLENR